MLKNLLQNFLIAWKFPRWRWALVIALLSDAVGFGLVLIQPAEWVLDAVTAVVLFAVLGFRWALLWALVVEAVPALQLFPAWTLVVAALASTENRKLAQSAGAVEGMPDHIKTKHSHGIKDELPTTARSEGRRDERV